MNDNPLTAILVALGCSLGAMASAVVVYVGSRWLWRTAWRLWQRAADRRWIAGVLDEAAGTRFPRYGRQAGEPAVAAGIESPGRYPATCPVGRERMRQMGL